MVVPEVLEPVVAPTIGGAGQVESPQRQRRDRLFTVEARHTRHLVLILGQPIAAGCSSGGRVRTLRRRSASRSRRGSRTLAPRRLHSSWLLPRACFQPTRGKSRRNCRHRERSRIGPKSTQKSKRTLHKTMNPTSSEPQLVQRLPILLMLCHRCRRKNDWSDTRMASHAIGTESSRGRHTCGLACSRRDALCEILFGSVGH